MAMGKKEFIALADSIREHNNRSEALDPFQVFTVEQLDTLADWCQRQNGAFNRDRWLGYIDGSNGSGGQTNYPGMKV